MKNLLLSIWVGFGLSLAFADSHGQAIPEVTADSIVVLSPLEETLPTITMKFEPAIIALYVLVPPLAVFMGGHSYQINGKKKLLVAEVKPYLLRPNDPLLAQFYQKQQQNRIAWYVLSATGEILLVVGFVNTVLSIFNASSAKAASAYLLLGGGTLIAGVGFRIACLRNMRSAVDLYNYKYAGKKPAMSLNIGKPSFSPLGLGLYVKF